jgi:pimeloyl-ACP methyl ester carboxylesterase
MDLQQLDAHRATVATATGETGYAAVGDAGAPPAVFVHGVGTNAALWRNVIDRLPERRCLAIDLPGHGHTPAAPDQDLTLAGLADAVEAFCDALDLDAIDLVANDTGGGVAQIVAARRPGRLRSLALTNCETHDNVPPPAFQPTVDLARAGQLAPGAPTLLDDLATARAAVFAMGYESPDQPPLDVVDAFLRPALGTPDAAQRFEHLIAGLEPSALLAAESALRELTVPTLVVWGTADEFFELRWAHWLRDTIPGATEVVEIPGAKLFFPDERGPELAALLARHWATSPVAHGRLTGA